MASIQQMETRSESKAEESINAKKTLARVIIKF
jgi:hypothetical protein